VQLLRRRGEAAGFGHGGNGAQLAQGQIHMVISSIDEFFSIAS
jgi:hypothetical protein